MTLWRLAIHAQVTTLPTFRSTPRKPQTTYGYVKKIIDFHWIQSKYYLREMLSTIEYCSSHTFKTPCCCFENVPNTALTIIVSTINVSIDCKKNKVSNPFTRENILDCKPRQQVAWFVFCFKVCAKMMISLLLRLMRT